MDGRAMREQAIVSRRFSPPDSPRTVRPPGSVPPTCVPRERHSPIVSSTACRRASRSPDPGGTRRRAWKRSVSAADMVGTNMSL